MIVIHSDKIFALYVRTNRRVKWRYAEYGGMYKTVDDALNSAIEHFNGEPFEYLIQNTETGEETTGYVNWDK